MSGKAVFFDRDNTLIEDPGYINHPNQLKLLPGAAGALVKLKQLGYKLIVVSNQSAVARGIVTENVLTEIHDRLKQLFAAEGAYLDQVYYCPYHPNGSVEKYRKQSDLRKPNPGMLLLAADEMDIDLSASWMIGDSFDDVIAGRRAGCKTILIRPLISPAFPEPGRPSPDYQAVNIKEAANIIKRYAQSTGRPAAKPVSQPRQPADPQDSDEALEGLVRQPDEPKPQSHQTTEVTTDEKPSPGHSPQQILREILTALKALQRHTMYEEFSAFKLIAGICQLIVLFCLLMGIWFLLDTSKTADSVLISLGFSAVFQLMTLTLYIMHGRK